MEDFDTLKAQKDALGLRLTDLQRQCLQWYADREHVPSPEGRRVPDDHRWNNRQLHWALEHKLLHVGPNGWHVPTAAGHLALTTRPTTVYCVRCISPGEQDVLHIFSTQRNAAEFAEADARDHVLYDYVIDCPERMEQAAQ